MKFKLKEGTTFTQGNKTLTLTEDAVFKCDDISTVDQLAEVLAANSSPNLDLNLENLESVVTKGKEKFNVTYGLHGRREEVLVGGKEEQVEAEEVKTTSEAKAVVPETAKEKKESDEKNADGQDQVKLNQVAIHKEPLQAIVGKDAKVVPANADPEVKKQTGK